MASRPAESRIGNDSARIGQVSDASFGVGIGRSIGGLVDAVDRYKEMEDRAAYALALTKAKAEDTRRRVEARAAPDAGTDGHADRVAKAWDEDAAQLLANIRSPRVRKQAEIDMAQHRAQIDAIEYPFEIERRAERTKIATEDGIDLSANTVRTGADPDAYEAEFKRWDDHLNSLPLPEDAREKLRKVKNEKLTLAWWQSIEERDPVAAMAMLDDPGIGAILSPEQIERMRNSAEVEMRRDVAETRAKLVVAKAEVTEAKALIDKRLSAGEDVDPDEIAAVAVRVEQIGDASGAYDLAVKSQQAGINRETRDWRPQDYAEEINRIAALGEKASPKDQIRLAHLQSIRGARETEFNDNPAGYLSRNGLPQPALDLSDPNTVRSWVAWHGAAQRATGRNPGLPKEMIAQWRDQARQGPGQRVALAAELQALPGPYRLMAAREIDGDDEVFEHVVTLRNPKARELALAGGDLRKANPALLKNDDAATRFAATTGRSLSAMAPRYVANVRATADAIYASIAARAGVTEFSESLYDKAIAAASEARIAVINNARVAVPVSIDPKEFETRLARWQTGLPASAANGVPVNDDGTPLKIGFIKSRLTPRWIGGTLYRFEDATGAPARTREGKVWQVDLTQLPKVSAVAEAPRPAPGKAMPAVAPLRRPDGPQAFYGAPPK
jgi:Arc/MetJ family transcription regulator